MSNRLKQAMDRCLDRVAAHVLCNDTHSHHAIKRGFEDENFLRSILMYTAILLFSIVVSW